MSRRKRHHAHANHERWLVSYADFITLLFAFFVVLYASAQVDQRKVGKLALAIQVAFQDMGVFPTSTTEIPLNSDEPMPFNKVQAIENATHGAELGRIASSPNGTLEANPDEADFSTLQTQLQQSLKHELSLHTVALHRETEGLVISLREFGFFDSGSAALKPSALPVLDRIVSILAPHTYHLRVEGHTDSIPIHNAQMASNWELSTARSTELVRLLIQRYKFAPEKLSAAGFAEYHPVASNQTAEGRAQNRRVDLVVLSEHPGPITNSAENTHATRASQSALATQNPTETRGSHSLPQHRTLQGGAVSTEMSPTPAVPLPTPPNH
jgi:chemotaxis protein MotB